MELKDHIPRLFVRYGDPHKLDYHGLPDFPSDLHVVTPQDFWEKWQAEQCIVLLGEPGIGKSTEFEFQYVGLKNSGQYCFLVRLKYLSLGCTLDDLIDSDDNEGWKNWKTDPTAKGFLFLDSLDEARLDYESALKQIMTQIRVGLPYGRLQIRLSCRVRDWRSLSDKNQLNRIFLDRANAAGEKQEGVKVLELLPFHYGGIRSVAEKAGVDPDGFVSQAKQRRVLHLCSHPLLLEFLLKEYKEKGEFASTVTDAYSTAIDRLLLEENPEHGEARKISVPGQRRTVASKLASLCILSGQDSLHVPDMDKPAQPCIDSCLTAEPKSILLETLNTKAFTSSRPGEFRFFHRTVAEFLAAEFLANQVAEGMRFFHLRPLLFSANQGVPTPVRGAVSWLAGLSKRAREECLKTDPLVVLEGDLSSFDRGSKEFIIKYLASRFAARKWQREVMDYGELASGVDNSLLIDPIGKHNAPAVRTMALHMILEGGADAVVLDHLLKIVFDNSDDEDIRILSAMILGKQGNEEQIKALKVFLARSGNSIFEDEMTGAILSGLFPRFLTVEEALHTLHDHEAVSRHVGQYHIFWHVEFEREIANEDLHTAIELLFKRIIAKDARYWDDYQNNHLAELFSRLVSKYLYSTLNPSSKTISPWLKLLTESSEVRHASDDAALKRVEEWLRTKASVKEELFILKLESDPPSEPKRFILWRQLPFPQASVATEDFEWAVQLFEQNSDEWRKHAFFQMAMLAWSKGNHLPSDRMTELIRLSEQCDICKAEWQKWRSCEYGKWQIQRAELEKKNRKQPEQNRILAKENIGLIEEGNADWLAFFSSLMTKSSGRIVLPKFSLLEEEFGSDVRSAAEMGYAAAWQSASVRISEERWESNQVPWYEIVISHAIVLLCEEGRIDWASVLAEQVRAAAYIAIKYYDSLPEWFVDLYNKRTDIIEELFEKILSIESTSKSEHLTLCSKIFYSKVLTQEFQRYASKYLSSHPLPGNQAALDRLLASSVRSRDTHLTDIVATEAVNLWSSIQESGKEQLLRAMSLLVAWWYSDWSSAWQFIIDSVFTGSEKIQHILSFAHAMMRMLGEPGFSLKSWPADMPVDAAIAILPYLYEAIPPGADTAGGGGIIGDKEMLQWFRHGVLNFIQSSEPRRAKEAFSAWAEEPLFAIHRDYFLSTVGELDRRIVDEQWQPASAECVAQVIFNGSNLIRNQSDLFSLLLDLLDSEMRAALVNDTSLVPLLWEGTKKEGRTPKDEKPLQAVLANQLALLLKSRPIVFAREPEVFDAKKPDFRVSAIVPDLGSVHVPIEVKQAHAADVWISPFGQLFEKYMKEPSTNSGLYLVGWYGPCYSPPVHPTTGKKFTDRNDFQEALQTHSDAALTEKGKKIAVFVFDLQLA